MRWEVRTMRSGTSFFNGTVYKKTLLRFWPIWAICLVIWLIAMPINGLMSLTRGAQGTAALIRFAESSMLYFCGGNPLAMIVAVLVGVMAAMAVCSHLYGSRSANFVGSLPVRREGLFLSHYLAGLTMLVAPNVVVFLLTLLVEAAGGAVVIQPLAFWLLYQSALEFFFYSFAVCIGMFAGHILALPAFYAIFNLLATVLHWLLMWVMEAFYYGFDGFGDGAMEVVRWLTPVWGLSSVRLQQQSGQEGQWDVVGGRFLAIYAVAALILAVCALLLYRRRRLESAGDVVAVRIMRPVFRYGVAICAGLSLGFLTGTVLDGDELVFMIAILLWGVAGAFVAQMILDKTFRVFRKWKGAAVTALVFLALFAVVGFDLTGYESRVPATDQVASVRIDGLLSEPNDGGSSLNGVFSDDPEVIADITALHRTLTEVREDDENSYRSNYLSVTYTLKNGSILSRYYGSMPMTKEVVSLARSVLDNRALIWDNYGFGVLEEPGVRLVEVNVSHYIEDGYQGGYVQGQDAQALLDAVVRDFEAGRIGTRSLMTGGAWEVEQGNEPTELTFYFEITRGEGVVVNRCIDIMASDTAVETLAVLSRLELESAETESYDEEYDW